MPNTQDVIDWKGQKLVGQDGDKIGTIDEIYVDEQTGEPEWLAVSTGLFGSKVSFVPLAEAQRDGDDIRVPYSKDQVKDAPTRRPTASCPGRGARLYRHYGSTTPSAARTPACRRAGPRRVDGTGADDREGRRDGRPRRLRPRDRRRHDALRGGAARRHGASARPAARGCASTSSPRRSRRRSRCSARRSASSASRSRTPTATRPCPAATSPRRSTR